MRIGIDRESSTPVYIQIFEQIRDQILSGELLPGFRLPPERKLAESLGINRSTALNAYRELKAEGFVDSHVGKGTIVLPSIHGDSVTGNINFQEPSWNQIFSQYSSGFDSYVVKDLLTLASRKDVISFATGISSPETGPIEALKGIEDELVGRKNYKPLIHSPTEGFTSLREAICELMQKRGVYCTADEVMLLSGSQQGLDLAARIILDPGDIAVVEEPSFFPAIQAFKSVGARVMSIPVDDTGIRLDILEQLLQRYRPKLIYTMPNFQNPSSVEMGLSRRRHLVELAYKYRVVIVEDDAYGEICYEGNPLPALKSMDNEGYVIYLSTFSKIVYPGLRLGWMVAHKKVISRFSAVKQITDLHSSSLSQFIIERFIKTGGLYRHISDICKEYKAKRDTMCSSLLKYAPKGLTWNKPRGGYYIWCKLPDDISALKLIPKAAERKVVFVHGTPFFLSGQGDNYLRLNFTFASLEDIDEGIRRLCEAIKELMADSDRVENHSPIEINPIF